MGQPVSLAKDLRELALAQHMYVSLFDLHLEQSLLDPKDPQWKSKRQRLNHWVQRLRCSEIEMGWSELGQVLLARWQFVTENLPKPWLRQTVERHRKRPLKCLRSCSCYSLSTVFELAQEKQLMDVVDKALADDSMARRYRCALRFRGRACRRLVQLAGDELF